MSATALPCFALLDDASSEHAHARLLQGLHSELQCNSAQDLPALLEQMQAQLRLGRHALLLLSYELGAAMQQIAPWPANPEQPPFAQVLIFQHCKILQQTELATWLDWQATAEADELAGVADMQTSITQAEFDTALAQIHRYLQAGHTYQVNFTYRLRFSVYGGALHLYRRLRQRQPVPYGALIQLPDGRSILSLSPELFVRHSQGRLLAQPMKGTARASSRPEENAQRAQELAQDPKNRAENLMIVDLLRNDLGRIAKNGTVQVPALFEVKRYSSVLQMTSTVSATLKDGTSINDVMQALYPCGSITGAPKRRTMEIIRELEQSPRGIYTGTIGWFAPPTMHKLGDFCLSVPIRTMLLQAPQEDGLRQAEMGVGAGIVYDSKSHAEFQECQLKASFLTGLEAPLHLFETIYATREEGCRHQEAHLARLAASCTWFGMRYDLAALRERLHTYCANLPPHTPHRLKLIAWPDGGSEIASAPLAAMPTPATLLISREISPVPRFLLRHKSSVRETYDAAWRRAEKQGAFDQLFCNADGWVTEGGRSNIFIKLHGQWLTPPVADGVLPGIMRAQLLQDNTMQAKEASISLNDLKNASEVLLCNALRGAFPVRLLWQR